MYHLFGKCFLALNFICLVASPVRSQVSPDSSLGSEQSSVVQNQTINGINSDLITGGAKRGANLFHSFQDFNVAVERGVYFANPSSVNNILARVTGNSPSNIMGTLGVDGKANLFLLNPNGIIFGSNARLDINGSFLGTTATSINFSDGTQFSARGPQTTPLLTVSIPIGLGFTEIPKPIEVKGEGYKVSAFSSPSRIFTPKAEASGAGLRVQPGNTLSLVGGNVLFDGGIVTAPDGLIEIGSVETGQITINPDLNGWKLDYSNVQKFQNIQLDNVSLLNASGSGGGSIYLQGKQVVFSNGSFAFLQTLGDSLGGKIVIDAKDTLEIKGRSITPPTGTFYESVQDRAGVSSQNFSGQGANINISTKNLILQLGGSVTTSSPVSGFSGNISINASNSIQAIGFSPVDPEKASSGISVRSGGSGNAGNISINTSKLSLIEGGYISSSTFGRGMGGTVDINASESIFLQGVNPFSLAPSSLTANTYDFGNAADLFVSTPRLTLLNGGVVASASLASGSAGRIIIDASDFVKVSGTNFELGTTSLIIASGARVDPLLQKELGIPTTPSGNSGSLAITTKKIEVDNGAQITVRNDGVDNAGSLQIHAESIKLDNQGSITAATASGEGGNIFLNSRNLQMRNGSTISATAGLEGGGGNGGNITIDTDTIAAVNRSSINANAFTGRGGNIQITTQGLFHSPDSIFSASSQFGIDGTVDVRTFGLEPDEALVPLNQVFIPTEQVVANSCLARRNKSQNRFVITGSGGLPESPNDSVMPMPLFSDRGLEQSLPQRSRSSAPTLWQEGDPVVEATGIVKTEDGRTLLGMAGSGVLDAESAICR
ncbi:hypothetical protein B7486_39775 [cyanobacterium TDX16]|nr:hypothetical protein B7486_39775 [cyanobacterium TDX16]